MRNRVSKAKPKVCVSFLDKSAFLKFVFHSWKEAIGKVIVCLFGKWFFRFSFLCVEDDSYFSGKFSHQKPNRIFYASYIFNLQNFLKGIHGQRTIFV